MTEVESGVKSAVKPPDPPSTAVAVEPEKPELVYAYCAIGGGHTILLCWNPRAVR